MVITFQPGDERACANITIIDDDVVETSDEQFIVEFKISGPGVKAGMQTNTTVHILDDDRGTLLHMSVLLIISSMHDTCVDNWLVKGQHVYNVHIEMDFVFTQRVLPHKCNANMPLIPPLELVASKTMSVLGTCLHCTSSK